MIVARQRTPYPLADLLGLLDATGHEVLVTCPGPDRLSVAWAQLVLEHGVSPPEAGAPRMLRGLWGNNFGNRDASRAELADAAIPVFATVPEREVGATGDYLATHYRRAYPSPEAGAVAWWESMRDRWQAIDAMCSPEAFAAQLKREGYYTASEASYAAALRPLAAQAARMWAER